MHKHTLVLMIVFLLALPTMVVASNCCPSETAATAMTHEQDSMAMHGDMIMLGAEVSNGIKGMAHLKDVRAAMSKIGMATTHHLMMMFSDVDSGEAIDQGSVAVKVTTPAGEQLKAVKLIGMQGHFGADVTLNEKGTYTFRVGTRLEDGQKRLYTFSYINQ